MERPAVITGLAIMAIGVAVAFFNLFIGVVLVLIGIGVIFGVGGPC